MTINDVVSEVINQYGIDVLLDGTRFCSIVNDLAPKMETENKIIRRLNQEKLLAEIYKIKTKSHLAPEDISRLLALLEHSGFSEEWKRISLESFSLSEINNTKIEKQPSNRSDNDSNTVNENRTINSFNLNGLYYYLESKDNNGCHINCIRFYADGRVVSASVCLDSIDQLCKVATWLKWETDRMYKGHYTISKDKLIEFDIKSPSGNGIIHYEGWISKKDITTIHLKWNSTITNKSSEWFNEYNLFDPSSFSEANPLELAKTPTISNHYEKTTKEEKLSFFNRHKRKAEDSSLNKKNKEAFRKRMIQKIPLKQHIL